jgi:hypothetical protein
VRPGSGILGTGSSGAAGGWVAIGAGGRGTAPESTTPFLASTNGGNRELVGRAVEAAGLVFDSLQNVVSLVGDGDDDDDDDDDVANNRPAASPQTDTSGQHQRRGDQRDGKLHPVAEQRDLHFPLGPSPDEQRRRSRAGQRQRFVSPPQAQSESVHTLGVQDVSQRSDLLLREYREHVSRGIFQQQHTSLSLDDSHPDTVAATPPISSRFEQQSRRARFAGADFFASGIGLFVVGDRTARSVVERALRHSRNGQRRSDCYGDIDDELFGFERPRRARHPVQGVEIPRDVWE